MAAASSSGDADAGDRLKGSATSGVTGLRAAADEVATAAATREQAAVLGSQPTTPAPSPRRPRHSRPVSASRPAGRGERGGGRAASNGRRATQRQRRRGSRRAAPPRRHRSRRRRGRQMCIHGGGLLALPSRSLSVPSASTSSSCARPPTPPASIASPPAAVDDDGGLLALPVATPVPPCSTRTMPRRERWRRIGSGGADDSAPLILIVGGGSGCGRSREASSQPCSSLIGRRPPPIEPALLSAALPPIGRRPRLPCRPFSPVGR
uniref:Uncharacterized protein n=1 Tax=Oryza meridionalis TaxID=40149 RepID=A0A0E0CKI2_9ORYZ